MLQLSYLTNVIGITITSRNEDDGNVTHDWTRSYWFKGKKRDYYIYKQKIDDHVKTLQDSIEPKIEKLPFTPINPYYSLIPLAAIGFLLLYSRGGKS